MTSHTTQPSARQPPNDRRSDILAYCLGVRLAQARAIFDYATADAPPFLSGLISAAEARLTVAFDAFLDNTGSSLLRGHGEHLAGDLRRIVEIVGGIDITNKGYDGDLSALFGRIAELENMIREHALFLAKATDRRGQWFELGLAIIDCDWGVTPTGQFLVSSEKDSQLPQLLKHLGISLNTLASERIEPRLPGNWLYKFDGSPFVDKWHRVELAMTAMLGASSPAEPNRKIEIREGKVFFEGKEAPLTRAQFEVFEVTYAAGPQGLTMEQLDRLSGRSDARKILGKMRKQFPYLAPHIVMAGTKGGRYRIVE